MPMWPATGFRWSWVPARAVHDPGYGPGSSPGSGGGVAFARAGWPRVRLIAAARAPLFCGVNCRLEPSAEGEVGGSTLLLAANVSVVK